MLRVQRERMNDSFFPSEREYSRRYGLDARPGARPAGARDRHAPGPMNRGMEIAPEVADSARSTIVEQVANGVSVRMAVLYLMLGGQRDERVPDQGRHGSLGGRADRPARCATASIAEAGDGPSARPRAPRSSTPTGWSPCPAWSTCTPTCASRAARTPRRCESGSRAAALGGYTAVCAMANTSPVADTAGVVEQVWRLGREAGLVDVQPIGAVTRRAGRRAAGRARRDGRLGGPGADLLRRRALRGRPAADAPGAGVRQGVRRGDRPARRGAAADRGRADARGRRVGPARACPAGRRSPRRRSSPGTCCWPSTSARGCTSATSPPPAASRSCAGPRRRGIRVTAEVTPHHLLLTDERRRRLRPGVQGEPAAAHRAPTSRRCGPALVEGVIDVGRHRPRPARGAGQGVRVGATPGRACSGWRPRCPSWSRRCSTSWAGTASPSGCRAPRPASPAWPSTATTRPSGAPANLTLVDPAARWTVDPAALASRSRNTPYAGHDAAGRRGGDFLRGEADGAATGRRSR